MQLVPSDQDEAKDCFLRFCACRGNVPKGAFFSRLSSVSCGLTMPRAALATLKVMISAPGFSPKLLQWAYKLAAEQNDKNLAFAITELLCEVCQAPEVAAQLDYMVLTRCVASSLACRTRREQSLALQERHPPARRAPAGQRRFRRAQERLALLVRVNELC